MKTATALLVVLVIGCTRTYHAEAVFMSAPLVSPGTPVMVGEQQVGQTGATTVVAGMLHVRLALLTPDALPDETILVLERDARGTRLVAHPDGAPLHLDGTKPFLFCAAANQRDYWRLRLQRKWEELTR